jgi:hypothetical protein
MRTGTDGKPAAGVLAEVTAVEWAPGGAVVRCKIGAKLSIEKVRRARPTHIVVCF